MTYRFYSSKGDPLGTKGLTALEPTTNKYKYTEMYTHSRTVPVSSMFILKLKPYKLYAHRSFCQRVTLPMTSSPTYEVDSATSNVSSPTQGHFYPYTHINYSLFFTHCRAKLAVKYVYPELNAIQLIPCSFIHAPYNLFLVLSSTAKPNEKVFWTLHHEVTGM